MAGPGSVLNPRRPESAPRDGGSVLIKNRGSFTESAQRISGAEVHAGPPRKITADCGQISPGRCARRNSAGLHEKFKMTFGVRSEALKHIRDRPMASRRPAEPLDRHSVRSSTTVKGYPMQPKRPILIWKVLPSSFFASPSSLSSEARRAKICRFAHEPTPGIYLDKHS